MKRTDVWALVALTFASVASLSASGKTVYVSPNGSGDQSGSSPENACAGVAAGYAAAASEDTIKLLEGPYLLDGSVSPMCVVDKGSAKPENLVFEGDPEHPERVVIDGGGHAVTFFAVRKPTTIRGITFCNTVSDASTQGIVFDSANVTAAVEKCVFSGIVNTSKGGAAVVAASAAAVDIRTCTFSGCSATAGNGGAVADSTSGKATISIYDSTFTNCTAKNGGALAYPFRIYDSTFVDCSATADAGAIFRVCANGCASNCTFTLCSAMASAYGGGAVFVSADFDIYDSVFRTNSTASAKTGGAVYATGTLRLHGCSFFGNVSADGGGAVSNVELVEGGTFEGNYAAATGGGALYSGIVGCVVSNCTFTGNMTKSDIPGGACYFIKEGKVLDSTFRTNSAPGSVSGGAVAVKKDTAGVTVTVDGGWFEGNVAKNGGAVADAVGVFNATFVGNRADVSGGVGGAVLCSTSIADAAVTNCTFRGNEAASNGGGVYFNTEREFLLADCTFTGNRSLGGSTKGGGGMKNKGTLTIERCAFTGNAADQNGGGFFGANVVRDCGFTNNVCGSYGSGLGGAVENAFVDRCVFADNVATTNASAATAVSGGALYCSAAGLQVRNSLFVRNISKNKGPSALSVTLAPVSVDNCTFVSNATDFVNKNIGAVRFKDNAPVMNVTNCIFFGNVDSAGTLRNFGTVAMTGFGTCASDDGLLTDAGSVLLVKYPFAGADDFRLRRAASPCVNAGVLCAWMDAASTDLAGKPRVNGNRPDMGCYEYYPTGGLLLLLR